MISESEAGKAFCSEMNMEDISKQKISQGVLERRLEKEGEKEKEERGGEGRGERMSKGGNEEEGSRNKETQRDTGRREMAPVERDGTNGKYVSRCRNSRA